MAIHEIHVHFLRNITSARFVLCPGVNVFYGDNGAGKTSILEAVHLLALARSFKTSRTRTAVQYESEALIVRGDLDDGTSLGISRSSAQKTLYKVNAEVIKSLAQVALQLPIQLIHSDSFALLEGSPSDRRQFLDWGVFHHQSNFHEHWQTLQKCLKNRNSLLRSGRIDRSEIAVWEDRFIKAANAVNDARIEYLKGFVPCFTGILEQLLNVSDLKIHYAQGWDKSLGLDDVLNKQRARDEKLGFTQSGPQRADLKVKLGKHNAADVLSRGQQKLVVCALKIAQSLFLQQSSNKQTVFLVDDLPAELDETHIKKLGHLFESLNAQVLMTTVMPEPLTTIWKNTTPVKMFHVEHGNITETETETETERVGDKNE